MCSTSRGSKLVDLDAQASLTLVLLPDIDREALGGLLTSAKA
jgi:hypothetical protein